MLAILSQSPASATPFESKPENGNAHFRVEDVLRCLKQTGNALCCVLAVIISYKCI